MAYACRKLARRTHTSEPVADFLAVAAYGVACAARVVIGLASEFLNIGTCIGPVQGLCTVPVTRLKRADIFRRAGMFDRAVEECRRVPFDRDIPTSIAEFEVRMAKENRDECFNVGHVLGEVHAAPAGGGL